MNASQKLSALCRTMLKTPVLAPILHWARGRARLARIHLRFMRYGQWLADGRFKCLWKDRWTCLNDATSITPFDPHYLYHTAWAARVLAATRPQKHVDVSSCLRFASIASAFVPIDFYDYRPAELRLSGLTPKHADMTALPFATNSIPSLSCMHVVEHIGLGRYGDPLDPQGDLKAMRELCRVLAPKGHLLFVVPIGGTARIQYNAHRIYTYPQLTEIFSELVLEEFALITDSGDFIEKAHMHDAEMQKYGCGCFLFHKPNPQQK